MPLCLPTCLSVFLSILFPRILVFCLSVLSGYHPTCVSQLPTLLAYLYVCLSTCLFYYMVVLSASLPVIALPLSVVSCLCVSQPVLFLSICYICRSLLCVSQCLLPIPRLPACLHDCLPACPFPSICVSKDCVLYLSHLPTPPTPLPIPLHPPPPTLFPTSGSQACSQPRPDWELQVPAARAAVADVGAVGGRGLTAAG